MDKIYQLSRLESEGFNIPNYDVILGKDVNDETLKKLVEKHKAQSPFALDGVVLEVNNRDVRNKLENEKRSSKLNPAYAKKFKVADETNNAVVVVKKVHWQITKDARLRPRVEIEPVDLMGVTITYVTCHNAKYVVDNNIGTDALLRITRSGDVIPYILDIVKAADEPMLPEIPPADYDWDENEVDFVLADESHPTVLLRRLKFGINALGVEYLGDGSIEKLFEGGYRDLVSVIKANHDDVYKTVGSKTAIKGMTSLNKVLNPVKENFLGKASGCFGRGIGSRILEPLVAEYGELTTKISLDDILKFDGIQETTAKKIHAGLTAYETFKKSIEGYYTLASPEKLTQGGEFDGVSFVFTGFRDKDAQATIESKGGKVASGVSKNVKYVVTKDPNSGSSKIQKARSLGCEIISIEEMKEMLC